MFKLFRNKHGMTLIEVLVAMTIFALMVIPLTSIFIFSNQRARNTAIERQALAMAEARIESLRDDGFKGFLLKRDDDDVTVEESDGKFAIEIKATFDEAVSITLITVTVTYEDRAVSLTTLASKSRR